MPIETEFMGTVGKDATPKISATGKKYMRVGDGDNCQWVIVTVFGSTVDEIAGLAVKGMPLYVEGRLTLDSWTGQGGKEREGLSVAAWRCKPPEIGRSKARSEGVEAGGTRIHQHHPRGVGETLRRR